MARSRANRLIALCAGAACVIGLAACGGHKSPTVAVTTDPVTATSSASTPATPTAAATPDSGQDVTAAQLGGRLTAAAAKLTSAHLAVTISGSGQNVTAVGDEKLSAGKLAAFRLAETVGSAKLSIIVIGTAIYVQAPAATGSQKYVTATPGTKNAVIQQLSATLTSAEQNASPAAFSQFARAATSVTTVGVEKVGSTPATHYKFVVDVAKLPKTATDTALLKSGVKTLPIDLWIDAGDRPVKVSELVAVGTEKIATNILLSRFNTPVTITKPATD